MKNTDGSHPGTTVLLMECSRAGCHLLLAFKSRSSPIYKDMVCCFTEGVRPGPASFQVGAREVGVGGWRKRHLLFQVGVREMGVERRKGVS